MASQRRSPTETEVKLRIFDLPAIIRRIRSLHPAFRSRVFEQNTLYDTPDAILRRSGCLLRLRTESTGPHRRPSRAILTAKMPIARESSLGKYKQLAEREAFVRHPAQYPAILRSLGFRPGFRYQKHRTSFHLPGVHVDLDETPVGNFLELEGSPLAIDRVARQLGFSPQDYIRITYWGLYAADCRSRGIVPGNMVFQR